MVLVLVLVLTLALVLVLHCVELSGVVWPVGGAVMSGVVWLVGGAVQCYICYSSMADTCPRRAPLSDDPVTIAITRTDGSLRSTGSSTTIFSTSLRSTS